MGLGVAEHFLAAGARVVITGRREDGPRIAESIGASFVRMDVADESSVGEGMRAAVGLMDGGLDTLILNAGIDLLVGTIDDLDLQAFRQVLEVNFFGVLHGLRHGVGYMEAGGSVIVTSSPAGRYCMRGMSAYSTSKAAVDMLVRTSALELASRGIRVNAVLPGIIRTEMSGGGTGEVEQLQILTARGVIRLPREIGGVYQFLASDASALLTGGAVPADDGILAGYSNELVTLAGFGE